MSDLHNKTPTTEKALRHKAEAIVSELEKNKTGNTPGITRATCNGNRADGARVAGAPDPAGDAK